MTRASARTTWAMGIDVGGTSVKGALLDSAQRPLVPIVRLATPSPARVGEVVSVIAEVAARLMTSTEGPLPIGVALSGDVRDGQHTTGVNLHPSWVGAPARSLIEAALGRPVAICNDADAAAVGEATRGAAAGVSGVVVVLTFGTGIGSGILLDGRLLPNSGLGQLSFRGRPAERSISAVARERRGQTWAAWAAEATRYLEAVDLLLRPDLIVLGGGIVNAFDAFRDQLTPPCPLVPAALGDLAGIVGAALVAAPLHPTARARASGTPRDP